MRVADSFSLRSASITAMAPKLASSQAIAVGGRSSGPLTTINEARISLVEGETHTSLSSSPPPPGGLHEPIQAEMDRSMSPLSEVTESSPPSKKKGTRSTKRKRTTQEEESTTEPIGKKPRKRRVKPEPVYIIPEVEKKETKFKGRLGYACLNTILRNKKPADDAIFCSRTCRIDTIKQKGIKYVQELARRNLEDLLHIIQWNEDNNIRFMRISSDIFPFASHTEYGYPLTHFLPLMSTIGELAQKYGHRLTTHPGQYVQLGSPTEKVLQASVRELKHHCDFLEGMGVGKDGVCIVHGGGVYGDKAATLERLKSTIRDVLPKNVRDRLVLENDEICYNAEDLLPLCEELDIPLVFDHHHDAIYPSSIPPSTIIARTNAIFARRGIRPKQHVSEPRPGAVTLMERRAHADRVDTLPDCGDEEIDLMIEAKDKEQAVFHLYRVYDLEPVVHANLRPPAENQTKETKGRKSNKSTRAKAQKDIQDTEEAEDPDGGAEFAQEDRRGETAEAVPTRGIRSSARIGGRGKVRGAQQLEEAGDEEVPIEPEVTAVRDKAAGGGTKSNKKATHK